MPLYMIEQIQDREKMYHMPLFESAEKRNHPQILEFRDHDTIAGNAFSGSQNNISKINANQRKVA